MNRSNYLGVMETNDAAGHIGYYKYTHIKFHYPNAIENPHEASAFKRTIHHSSLGDPSHPLWTDKEKGLELYVGK